MFGGLQILSALERVERDEDLTYEVHSSLPFFIIDILCFYIPSISSAISVEAQDVLTDLLDAHQCFCGFASFSNF